MYETEKARLLSLLSQATGITRQTNSDLEREADERAYEAYLQVGTGPQPDGTYMGITHPTQMECESRLGPQWAGKGVGEIAAWNFNFNDPVKSAAEGFMNSARHRAVLVDPKFKNWAAGIYTFKDEGAAEIDRRWYFIIWLSISLPTVEVEGPTTLPTVKNFKRSCGTYQINPDVNLRSEANLQSSTVIRQTAAASAEKIRTIGTTEGVTWNGSNLWRVGWMSHPSGAQWTFVHSSLTKRV